MAQPMPDGSICPEAQKLSCGNCRLNTLCLPLSLQLPDIDRLDDIVQRRRPLQKSQYLYRTGDSFRSLFAVRSGSVKTMTLSDEGEEQVTGFYLPGEILGLDGIAETRHTNSAVTLETASVCEIPFQQIEDLSRQIPSLQHHFFQLLSREITHEQQLLALMGKSSAQARVAAFLVSLANRNERRGLSPTAIRLPMSRADIGNFLGLTIETVSRVFSALQKQEVLAVNKKEIRILQPDALRRLSTQTH